MSVSLSGIRVGVLDRVANVPLSATSAAQPLPSVRSGPPQLALPLTALTLVSTLLQISLAARHPSRAPLAFGFMS